jgi:hypothetical protein
MLLCCEGYTLQLVSSTLPSEPIFVWQSTSLAFVLVLLGGEGVIFLCVKLIIIN